MIWAALIAMASFGASSDEIYVYPDVYEHGHGLGATVNEEALAKLIEDNTVDGEGETGIPHVGHKIDLNNDGKAEIFLAPTQVESYHGGWFDIFMYKDGQYQEIGSCAYWFSLRESKNGYAQILNHNNVGHPTEPIWHISISAYDATRYIDVHVSDLTSGQMETKGIEAYNAEDYAATEIWFQNLKRSGLCTEIQAENNLVLVLLRTKRYREVIDRTEKALASAPGSDLNGPWGDITPHKANAHYNLGKANEALGNLPAAWKNYYEACKLSPTDQRKATLKRLMKAGVDTTGYEVIW
jgi:tetratricopeptide (TPR) repeat protein